MSNGESKGIKVEPAHKALDTLIQEIERVGVENLPDRISSIPKPDAWLKSLKDTRRVLREWCDGFMLEPTSRR
jgi:hypothetical protein